MFLVWPWCHLPFLFVLAVIESSFFALFQLQALNTAVVSHHTQWLFKLCLGSDPCLYLCLDSVCEFWTRWMSELQYCLHFNTGLLKKYFETRRSRKAGWIQMYYVSIYILWYTQVCVCIYIHNMHVLMYSWVCSYPFERTLICNDRILNLYSRWK